MRLVVVVRRAKLEDGDLGGDAEADGDDARAYSRRNIEVASVLDDLPGCVAAPVVRGNDEAAENGKVHLSAMGMPRDREIDTGRKQGEQIRVVSNQQDRIGVIDPAERFSPVVWPLVEVTRAGHPK